MSEEHQDQDARRHQDDVEEALDEGFDEDHDEGEFIEVDQIPIRDASIRLGQLLKLANVVEHGGMAREVLDAGAVTVDEEVETRRGRQIRPGEIVQLDGEALGLPEAALTPVAEELEELDEEPEELED
ncbi:RNA-binding S4 domain-containing protein [Nesterenkonia halobia]|uniref:RNA-binding S4 domain-containing protein n=1 Tax=Nesterenkonia halobia TaxID=37922 RepID=A0ABP6R6F0_9MICC